MPNPNTPNEPESKCFCPVCVAFPDLARAAGCVPVAPLAKAAARAPETASQYLAREQAEIFAARRARADESDRLRTFLKDCGCPCCSARARLRAISYDRAENSAADIHCASTDRRDDNADPRRAERIADAIRAAAEVQRDETDARLAALRESDEERQAVRAAAEGFRKDTDAGPAGAD